MVVGHLSSSDLQIKIEGTDANFTLATQTGVSKKDAKPSDPQPKMKLTPEEQEIFDGKKEICYKKR